MVKLRFGRRWRGSEAGRHEEGKYLAGTSRKVKPTSGLESLSSSHYACTRFCGAGSSISARPALRILSAYVLCLILLDSRHYQLERWCVMRCNECPAVSSAPIPYRGLGIALCFTRSTFYLQIWRRAGPTSGLEPLICSLRVCGQQWLSVAGVCKFGISKGFSVPCIAHYCTVLHLG